MRPWFLLFLFSIGAGGFFALLVALARTPGVSSLLPEGLFYHWLIGHVDLALIIGFLSFLVAQWHRVFGDVDFKRLHLFAYAGASLIFLSALLGLGTPVHNNYVPTLDHTLFFAGVVLFGVGYLLSALSFLRASLPSLISEDPLKAVLSVSVLLSLIFGLSLLLSFMKTPRVEETYLYFERLYWLPGHVHQFVNATLLIYSWSFLSRVSGRDVPRIVPKLSLLLLPFPVIYLIVQIFTEDTIAEEVKALTTLGYAVGIGVPTLVSAVVFLVRSAFRGGFFSNSLGISVVIYIMGASMGYLIAGSDLRIPAHYHGVIASILISLMVLTYYHLRELGFVDEFPKLVRIQPYLYGVGMILFVMGLFWSGYFGAPRKTPGTGYIESMEVYAFMLLMGLGSILSVVGGIIFVGYVLYSIIKSHEYGSPQKAQP